MQFNNSHGALLILCLLFSLSACTSEVENKRAPPTGSNAASPADASSSTPTDATAAAPAGAATPEATFAKFKAAMNSKDYKTAFAQMTPETQEVMLGAMATMLNFVAALDKSKETEVRAILDKHGVKKLDLVKTGPNVDQKSSLKQLSADVKDKPACLAEIITWMENNAPATGGSSVAFGDMGDAQLVDVKLEGATATGTVRTKQGTIEKSDPAKFVKVSGVWLIDMTDMLPAGPAGPAAPTLPTN